MLIMLFSPYNEYFLTNQAIIMYLFSNGEWIESNLLPFLNIEPIFQIYVKRGLGLLVSNSDIMAV